MARNWKDVRAQARALGTLDEQRIEALRAKLRAEVRAHRLAEIRQAYGLDQSMLAERLGVSQSHGAVGQCAPQGDSTGAMSTSPDRHRRPR